MTNALLYQIPIQDAEFSVRTTNCLQAYGRFPTLGHLDAASDADLMAIPHFGARCLREVREVVKNVRCAPGSDYEIVAWALGHQILVRALIAGQAVIVPAKSGDA